MDRFNESPFPAARFDRDEDGYPELPADFFGAVLVCEHCGCTAERLSTMPAYKLSPPLQACDQCMEEDAIEREREALELPRREMLTEAGCTQAQSDAYIREVA